MIKENLPRRKGTILRKNDSQQLILDIDANLLKDLFLINGNNFLSKVISKPNLIIKPYSYYMIINNRDESIRINYSHDISKHEVIYNPYKHEGTQKIIFEPEFFINRYDIPKGYVDTLPKWYSFKFIYKNYNLIFIKPEFGLSIQVHKYRSESWEIIEGKPIVLNGDRLFYFVRSGKKFHNPKNTFHSIINPNKEGHKFVIIKEKWHGNFDENDIIRVFNPNKYN